MSAAPRFTVAHMIDTYWCDSYGTFVEGWVLVHEAASERVEVQVGHHRALAQRTRRDDLVKHYPDPAHTAESGFSAYVPGAPAGEVTLLVHTALGVARLDVQLPDHPLPEPADVDARYDPIAAFTQLAAEHVEEAPDGAVLVLGARSASQERWQRIRDCFGGRRVVSVDIHPGIGVDVVGDAHRLSRFLRPERFAFCCSGSLLEHVSVPWLVAAEIGRVLMPGGLSLQVAPWLWPTHSGPNDFWRFSEGGMAQLFGPATGFEVLTAAGTGGVLAHAMPEWRDSGMRFPTTSSHAMSWVLSRRLARPASDASWPYDPSAGSEVARSYPRDGLML